MSGIWATGEGKLGKGGESSTPCALLGVDLGCPQSRRKECGVRKSSGKLSAGFFLQVACLGVWVAVSGRST